MKIVESARRHTFSIPLLISILSILLFSIISGTTRHLERNFQLLSTEPKDLPTETGIISCSPGLPNFVYYGMEAIEPNDNRHPAGKLKDGVLTLNLEVREGVWYPETSANSGFSVYAFAEAGKPLQLPGPLVRIPEGTEISITIRNTVPDKPLNLHGLHSRPGDIKDSIIIAPGASWSTRFQAGKAGTYYYKGTMGGIQNAGWPILKDGQLFGAIIIDSVGVMQDTSERILMISRVFERRVNKEEKQAVAINGLSWPFTERLTYTEGEEVKWRVINSGSIIHPMHLHGFYFKVHGMGNGEKDSTYAEHDKPSVVTQLLLIGQSMRMSWTAERAGNWLFHCHMLVHIGPENLRLRQIVSSEPGKHDLEHHARDEMAGLIVGIHVLPKNNFTSQNHLRKVKRRRIDLLVKEFSSPYDSVHSSTGLGFVLQQKAKPGDMLTPTIPGPPVVILQNEPVAINVINQTREPTSIHWHGIELDNYFDGVAGWGFGGKKLSPLISPGESFSAEITAPRAGTFIYHTHMHDNQLMRGLYGPLIVLKPGEKFDSVTDKIIVFSDVRKNEGFTSTYRKFLINGSHSPVPMRIAKGKKYRFRIINITEGTAASRISLMYNGQPATWIPLAKDGADLPKSKSVPLKADRQPMSVGETMDFEFFPQESGEYKLEVWAHTATFIRFLVKMSISVE